ncbi:MAG: branched-chain amino acid ABC transporter permease [Desulfarculales bacterium]|jgi:branched-chain amino acid transport system permease protein|nr:branched-chain amino acid ABC transporter permease [Desulfarculales bacterium]
MIKALPPALVAFLLLLPPLVCSNYWLDVLNAIGVSAILAFSLNLIVGQAGMFHMGHAAFCAVGAYTTAIMNTALGTPVLWTMPLAGMAAGFFALLVARPIIHLRGDYLLLVTIGIVEIVRIALTQDIFGLTGGANGIAGIDRPYIFGFRIYKPSHFYWLIWGMAGVTIVLFSYLERSRFGRALNYIREDNLAADGIGINSAAYKLGAFVLGAFWAGMVGTILVSKMTFVSPAFFTFWESVVLFVIVILGGAGNLKGVLLGAFLVTGLPEAFRDFEGMRMFCYGAAVILLMIFRPGGLLPSRPGDYNVAEFMKKLAGPAPNPRSGEDKRP